MDYRLTISPNNSDYRDLTVCVSGDTEQDAVVKGVGMFDSVYPCSWELVECVEISRGGKFYVVGTQYFNDAGNVRLAASMRNSVC